MEPFLHKITKEKRQSEKEPDQKLTFALLIPNKNS
jgi:hypothetical protein